MMWRQMLVIRSAKSGILGEFITPFVFAIILWVLGKYSFNCDGVS
jgi:ATP-binding cassette, subfamily A (ABC1), member 3